MDIFHSKMHQHISTILINMKYIIFKTNKGNLLQLYCKILTTFCTTFSSKASMDLIDDYQIITGRFSLLNESIQKFLNPYSIKQLDILKIKYLLKAKFKENLISFQNEIEQNIFTQIEVQKAFQNISEPKKCTQIINIENSLKFHLLIKVGTSSKDIYLTVSINQITSRIFFSSTILQNYRFLKITSKNVIKQLCKHFLSGNSKVKYGSMYIHPISGQIYHNYNNQITSQKLSYLLKQPQKFYARILEMQIPLIKRHWETLIQKYLYLIDEENSNFLVLEPKKLSFECAILQDHFSKIQKAFLKKTKYITQNCSLDHQKFIINKDIKKFKQISPSQKGDKVRFIQMQKNRIKILNLDESIKQFLQIFIDQKQIAKYYDKYIQNPQLQKQLVLQLANHLSCQGLSGKNMIYSQIKVTKVERQYIIFKSGFSQISLLDVYCKRQQDSQITFNRIVKKRTKLQKFLNEQNVIKTVKDERCLFISRYFYCQDIQHQQSIILEYCQDRSLDYFIKGHEIFLSLSTKVYFLYQVVLGLRFLRDYNIVHIDLKPQNVLVKVVGDRQKKYTTFIMKLIDFGQSYSTNFKNKKQGRGFTIPYASPELINQSKNKQWKDRFTQKTDVFAFGVMILEIIFQTFPTTLSKISKQEFSLNYINLFSIPFQKCRYFGQSKVMSTMYLLGLKCLSAQPNERPTLDWLCIYFKEFLVYLQNFYS